MDDQNLSETTGNWDQGGPPNDKSPRREVAGSPDGSQASQSSSRRNVQRVVELLPELVRQENGADQGHDDWVIRAEFYDEDILGEDDRMTMELDEDDDLDEVDDDVDDDDEDEDDDYEFQEDDDNIHPHFVVNGDDDVIDFGFIIPPNLSDESDSNDEMDEEINAVDYDITLPATHRYLGENMHESNGIQIFAEDSTVKLPLFNFRHIVMLPGQILPITTAGLSSRLIKTLKSCIKRQLPIIGLMSDPRNNLIGLTAEIRNYIQQEDEMRLILEGRQRFKLISQPFDMQAEGTVKILPEITLGSPYIPEPSCRRFLVESKRKKCRYVVSKHPMWLLQEYESSLMIKKILNQIEVWCKVDPTTKNPSDFSYWVAANLPLSNHERMKILKLGCTEQRLSWLLELLVKRTSFACASCKNVICSKDDVFPMSCSGPQNSYVNSHGHVHDTLTVRTATGLILEQEWFEEFCWFPGYLWCIAHCEHCNRHIGWRYKSKEPQIKPRRFFGLSRANVELAEPKPAVSTEANEQLMEVTG